MEDVLDLKSEKNVDKFKIKKGKNLKIKNKTIFLVSNLFIGLSLLNFYLIFSFIKILQNI